MKPHSQLRNGGGNNNNISSNNTTGKSKEELIRQIQKEKQQLRRIQAKNYETDQKLKKVQQSNERNVKRLLRHTARLQQLRKCKDKPELFLHYCGIMNEYVQAFMISHNFAINVDVTSMNPDNMSYQQLIQLGQKIGKVSKGLTKQEIDTLDHQRIKMPEEKCPICCTQFEVGEEAILLRCKHLYHDQCIVSWFKDENRCPMCKKYALKDQEE